ncbi:MAG: ATP-binding protein, partial [Spirochaetaceae bacterium]|nr:ATP-binding protein [Spirochaetaceae bacterium]
MRFFNTSGPVVAADHYCVPPLERINLSHILSLIETKRYFVLHAPRQTGKTSALLALRDLLNEGAHGRYRCVYVNVEGAQAAREDRAEAMRAILSELEIEAEGTLDDPTPANLWPRLLERAGPLGVLRQVLTRWAQADSAPLVLLIDEIDTLIGDTLIAVLRQLRAGYPHRPHRFPQSVILCGVRDVRDYRIHSAAEKAIVTGGSAFNIKAESLRLGDFSEAEVGALLGQHSAETGQRFAEEALQAVCELTAGQPWLVNALAQQACFRNESGRDRSSVITGDAIRTAREQLILRRETHLEQLTDRLQEERVRQVIGPLL